MKTSTEEHLRALFRAHKWKFGDRESWPIDELGRLSGDPLLHSVVSTGSVEDVKLLISRGANVNQLGEMDYTAMHCAVKRNSPYVAEALIEAGAKVNLKNEFGFMPLDHLKHRERELPPKVFKQVEKLLRRGAR